MANDTLARPPSLSRTPDLAIPLGLVALGLIPALGGATRLASFAHGGPRLPDAARFAAHPGVLAVHIVSALTYSLLGALQFSPGLRRRSPRLHRRVGRILVPAGLVAGLSGLASMLVYAPAPAAGPTLHFLRLMAGAAMIGFLALGLDAVRRREFAAHAAWMTRAYALGIAPGTQALVLIPITFGLGIDTEVSFTAGMAIGWLVNAGVAEWVLLRAPRGEGASGHPREPGVRSMGAIVYDRYGGPEELRRDRVPRPLPGVGQVLVRVEASSLNSVDRRMLRADPFLVRLMNGLIRPRLRVLGADVAGVVEAVGPGVRGRAVGDRVFGDASEEGLGAFAEYVCLREGSVAPIPDRIDTLVAASLPLAARTALQALREGARLSSGQRVLVWGAGGGVGMALVQMVKAHGGTVVAVAGPRSVDRLRSLGADLVLDRTQPLALDPASFDVVFGVNGRRALTRHLELLVPGGVYVMIGGESGQIFEALVLGAWRARARGRRLVVLTLAPALLARDLAEIAALVERGALRPVIDRVLPLAEVAAAIHLVERGEVAGKVVLDARSFGRDAHDGRSLDRRS